MSAVDTAGEVLDWLWRANWQASILVGLVLLVQWLFQGQLAPRWRHALWWLVVVRLLLPITPPSGLSLFNFAGVERLEAIGRRPEAHWGHHPEGLASHFREGLETRLDGSDPARTPAAPTTNPALVSRREPASAVVRAPAVATNRPPPGLPGSRLAALWLAGVGLLGANLAWANLRFARRLRRRPFVSDPALLAMLEECRQRVGLRQSPSVTELPEVDSPALFGFWRPRLLLPSDLVQRFSADELRHVFLHELCHVRRWDVPATWLVALLGVIHWFNPLVWLAFRRLRADRELACDALVLSLLEEAGGQPYGRTILKLLEGPTRPVVGPGLVGILEQKNQMKRRMRMIAKSNKSYRQSGFALLVFVALGVLTLTDARTADKSATKPAPVPKARGTTEIRTTSQPQALAALSASLAAPAEVVDPQTGLKFTMAHQISGKSDVIMHDNKISMSPNGRFLLWFGQVVPLDGGPSFRPEGLPGARDAAWSPDGRWIAFHDGGALWVLPVSPVTGHATGPARKLLEDNAEWIQGGLTWSADSERLLYSYYDIGRRRTQGCLSVRDGKRIQPPDYPSFGLPSPDGRMVAYSKLASSGGVWVAPVAGGAARLVSGAQGFADVPFWWSPDGQWLLCGWTVSGGGRYNGARFVHWPDRWEYPLKVPEAAGQAVLGVSPDRAKLRIYRNSHELRPALKVAKLPGGRFTEVKLSQPFVYIDDELSLPEEQRLVFQGIDSKGKYSFYAASLAGGPLLELRVKAPFPGEVNPGSPSRDGKQLLFSVDRGSKGGQRLLDLYVTSFSLDRGESLGTPILVFKDWQHPAGSYETRPAWSPDGKRLAVPAKGNKNGDLWVVSVDGSPPKRLTDTPEEVEQMPVWSPDGTTIAYTISARDATSLYTIPAAGGMARLVWTQPVTRNLTYSWFPDSQDLGLLADGAIVLVPTANGKTRPFLKAAELGLDWLQWFQWSPDGQCLAVYGGKGEEDARVALFRGRNQKVERLPGDPAWNSTLGWAADSQSLYCLAEQPDRKLPAARLYELDLVQALAQAKASFAKADTNAPAPGTPPRPPPLTNGEFRADFDDGDTQHWSFQDPKDEGPDIVREVRQGELVLQNSRANLGLPGWTNYVVKVRMCIKELGAQGRTLTGVGFRRSAAGSYLLSAEPREKDLWLGAGYTDNSKRYRVGMVTEQAYDFALDKWYAIQVEVRGNHIRVIVDGQLVIDAHDETFPHGAVGLLAARARVHFDDFSVRLLP